MKTTDTENPVPDRAQPHPERIGNHTNALAKYVASFRRTEYHAAFLTIEATSRAEAWMKAEEAIENDECDWELYEAEEDIASVHVAKQEGGSHE